MQDVKLETELEITVGGDGAVEKITVLRPSGVPAFDTAAIDAAHASAPYPVPAPQVRSPDGKTRVSWRFHRDDRQCSSMRAQAYLVLDAGEWERVRGEEGRYWDDVARQVRFRAPSRRTQVGDAGPPDAKADTKILER